MIIFILGRRLICPRYRRKWYIDPWCKVNLFLSYLRICIHNRRKSLKERISYSFELLNKQSIDAIVVFEDATGTNGWGFYKNREMEWRKKYSSFGIYSRKMNPQIVQEKCRLSFNRFTLVLCKVYWYNNWHEILD